MWSRIAEVGLLVSLGGGGSLLRFALQQMQKDGWYHFVVCQATLAAVGFYERIGFIRVGAVARYAPRGASEAELRAVPVTGYRHWADADELMVAEFGDTSYLMALDLTTWEGGAPIAGSVVDAYPEILTVPGKVADLRRMSNVAVEGGHLAYESGDGVVVSLMPEDSAVPLTSSAQLRMDIRYEVQAIVNHRGEGPNLEYEVVWAKWPSATWEPADNIVGAAKAVQVYWEKVRNGRGKGKR